MTNLLVVPLKKPTDIDICKPLKNLIQSSYNNTLSEKCDYSEVVKEFSKLRRTAIMKFFEKNESSLEIVYKYHDQLCALETKIPVMELQIPFKWKDAFDKGSIFGGRISLTHTSIMYEKVCVLFNIAALQCAIAAEQSFDNDDSLKSATKLFQQSAGIFNYLKGATPAAIPTEPTPDLNMDTLNVLCNLMLAQAQELFVVKAIKDNMNNGIIAKICCQCEELYAEVLRGMQKDSLRSLWDKEWIPTIAGKQAGFHAMTQFYQSLVCRVDKRVGEEIARLKDAVKLFEDAQNRSNNQNLFEEYAHKAKRNLDESKKDNDFIYNEMIPDVKTLQSPGKAQLSKPITMSYPMSQNFNDLFANLIPLPVHQAVSTCESRKNEIVNSEILKLREATQTMNAVLASLNLPAAIEMTDSSRDIPPSLIEKANEVRQKGGIDSISASIKELPELLNRNREILDESERLLDEEQSSDQQLRNQFKERWNRTPSNKLTEMFRSNAKKYREVITNAIAADKIVREKFEKNKRGIELLSQTLDQICKSLPVSQRSVVSNSASVQRLRTLMESVIAIKKERDVIESELKSATIDMKDEFMKALAQDGAINEPAMSLSTIQKTLSPLQEQVKSSIERQQSLLNDIQSAHQEFSKETDNKDGSREKLLSEMASAYDNFMELQNNLKEGTKFYNDLTQVLISFQNKISDFCFARRTEKEEILKDLTAESSRQVPITTPSIPSHYVSTTVTDSGPSGNTSQPTVPSSTPVPYPAQVQGMPVPYGVAMSQQYPSYVAPPMPQGFNPYATLPYPTNAYNYSGFPQGPQPNQAYGTYPGANPQAQGYPHPNTQKPPGWW